MYNDADRDDFIAESRNGLAEGEQELKSMEARIKAPDEQKRNELAFQETCKLDIERLKKETGLKLKDIEEEKQRTMKQLEKDAPRESEIVQKDSETI